MANVKHAYVGKNVDTDEKEMRIVITENGVEKDMFFGTGTDEDGEALTIEESKQMLRDDKRWRERVIILDKVSKEKNTPYQMAILSNIMVDEVLEF